MTDRFKDALDAFNKHLESWDSPSLQGHHDAIRDALTFATNFKQLRAEYHNDFEEQQRDIQKWISKYYEQKREIEQLRKEQEGFVSVPVEIIDPSYEKFVSYKLKYLEYESEAEEFIRDEERKANVKT